MVEAGRSSTAFAKTTQPTMGSAVRREALFAFLDGPPGRSIVWICGPPGSGRPTDELSRIATAEYPKNRGPDRLDRSIPPVVAHGQCEVVTRQANAARAKLPG